MTDKAFKENKMNKAKAGKYYRREARNLTNMLFDKGFLDPRLTRSSIDWLESYLGFLLQSKCEVAAESAAFLSQIKDRTAEKSNDPA